MDRRWESQRLTRSENGPCGPIGRVGGSPHTPSLSEQVTRSTNRLTKFSTINKLNVNKGCPHTTEGWYISWYISCFAAVSAEC